GGDRVEFLFSANKNVPLQPISQVASGGEIARVMLSLKAMISGTVKLPTIIFDEIDTGVSGKVAEQMAKMMREMGNSNRQVISITHLPQIAALGTTHYKVYKEDCDGITSSHMTLLNHDQRVNEIAQMLSGSDITQAAVDNAKELLSSV
ncbi:DNA repair protein RecN, partial [Parabacteroides distasonis]